MYASPKASHKQVAYVTDDLDAAMALFQREYGAPGFYSFSNAGSGMPMEGQPILRVALARVGGVEIELIQPIGGASDIFTDVLKGGAKPEIRFHHLAIRVDGTLNDWAAHRAEVLDKGRPLAFEGELGEDLRFFYTDERALLGHFVEHVWMSPGLLGQLDAVVPRYPTPA